MFKVFEQYLIDKGVKLSVDELATIRNLSVEKRVRRHQLLLQEQNYWRYNAFVCEGCLRMYRSDEKGEHILRFAFENWWIGDRESYVLETLSQYNIEAVEPSVVLTWTKENFDHLLNSIPDFKSFMDSLVIKNQIANQQRIDSSISLSAEEKYQRLVEKYPGITNRIPLHMIASYLGVTRETLSRVRNSSHFK